MPATAPLSDPPRLQNPLPTLPPGSPADRKARASEALRTAREALRSDLLAGTAGGELALGMASFARGLAIALFEELKAELPIGSTVCLLASGGIARGELAPQSDWDLGLLVADGAEAAPEVVAFAERYVQLLWDLRLDVGWSVRSIHSAAEAAGQEHTVRTSLMESVVLAGAPALQLRFEQELLGERLQQGVERFLADKVTELRARHERFGDTVFRLEPHLKQGEGGLRDLHAALWLARARFHAVGLPGLLQRSVLPPAEVKGLEAARDVLLRERFALHLESKRREDRLTFDWQERISALLGFVDGPEGSGVERFMRSHYLATRTLRAACQAVIERCEEVTRPAKRRSEKRLGAFKAWGDRLALHDPDAFEREPAATVEAFDVADAHGLHLHSTLRDRVVQTLPRLAQEPARSEAARKLAEAMGRPGTLGRFLPAMHDAGLLGAVLPEFGRCTALRQHDLFHVYTVDAHSLFAVQRLYALRAGEFVAAQPGWTRRMQELEHPLSLYLGMLFHDAAKGMGGDHSEKGVALVSAAARRMGLAEEHIAEAEFLVRKHLLLSHTSQRRDLSDPSLIAWLAAEVGSVRRLTLLALLTFADISSVGPETWTEWKGRLLQEAYDKACAVLEGRENGESSTGHWLGLRDQVAGKLGPGEHAQVERFLRGMPSRYLAQATPVRVVRHLKLLRRCRKLPFGALLVHRRDAGSSQLALTAADQPGLLATFAGVLSAHGLDVLSADVFSAQLSSDGPVQALDLFEVRGPRGGSVPRELFVAFKRDLSRVLSGEETLPKLLARRRLGTRPAPRVATRVRLDDRSSRDFTIVDVVAEDRVGLLHAITHALFEAGLDVGAARVATEGHRAIDAFYVRSKGRKLATDEERAAVAARVEQAIALREPGGGAA